MASPSNVQAIKQVLTNLGYAPGPVNGEIDDNLKNAVASAMSDLSKIMGLPPTDKYTSDVGRQMLGKIEEKREEMFGAKVQGIRSFAQGKDFTVGIPPFGKTYTVAELRQSLKDEHFSDQLINNINGVLYIFDHDTAFINAMNDIAPALYAPVTPAPAAAAPSAAPASASAKSAAAPTPAPAQSSAPTRADVTKPVVAGTISRGAAGHETFDARVADVQSILATLAAKEPDIGIDLGTYGKEKHGVDGKFGAKTESSIKAAQHAMGMAETGTITNDFVTRLRARVLGGPGADPGAAPAPAVTPAPAAPAPAPSSAAALAPAAAPAFDPNNPLGASPDQKKQDAKLSPVQMQMMQWVMSLLPPEAMKLIDKFLHDFLHMGLKDLLPGVDIPGLNDTDDAANTATPKEQLAKLYIDAHSGNRKPEDVNAAIVKGVEAFTQLPFGDEARRKAYAEAVQKSMDEANKMLAAPGGTIDKAAGAFADMYLAQTQDFDKIHGPATFKQTPVGQGAAPQVDASVQGMTFEGGHGINDVIAAYNDLNKGRDAGQIQAMIFKDGGKTYVAGIEKESNIFTVKEIDAAAVKAAYDASEFDSSLSRDVLLARSNDFMATISAKDAGVKFLRDNYSAQFPNALLLTNGIINAGSFGDVQANAARDMQARAAAQQNIARAAMARRPQAPAAADVVMRPTVGGTPFAQGPMSDKEYRQMNDEASLQVRMKMDAALEGRAVSGGIDVFTDGHNARVRYLDRGSREVKMADTTKAVDYYRSFADHPDKKLLWEQAGLKQMPAFTDPRYMQYVQAIATRDHIDLNKEFLARAPELRDIQANYPEFRGLPMLRIAQQIDREKQGALSASDRRHMPDSRASSTGFGVETDGKGHLLVRYVDKATGDLKVADVSGQMAYFNSFHDARVFENGKPKSAPDATSDKYPDFVRKAAAVRELDVNEGFQHFAGSQENWLGTILQNTPGHDDILSLASDIQKRYSGLYTPRDIRGSLSGVWDMHKGETHDPAVSPSTAIDPSAKADAAAVSKADQFRENRKDVQDVPMPVPPGSGGGPSPAVNLNRPN